MGFRDVYLTTLLEYYTARLAEESRELEKLPAGKLVLRTQKGKLQALQEKKTGGRRTYKGITRNEALTAQLARKVYLEKSTDLLASEIKRLETFLRGGIDLSPDNILKLLPKSYQNLPEELFVSERWKAEGWAAEPYKQNDFHTEEKIHTTSKGLKVRSKSELLIADKLDLYQIPYRYDALIHSGGYTFSPDFMIPTKEGMKYWEHCGMMQELKYRRRNKWKLQKYEEMGIYPWKNLMTTYDTEDGGINLAVIEAEITTKLLPIKL